MWWTSWKWNCSAPFDARRALAFTQKVSLCLAAREDLSPPRSQLTTSCSRGGGSLAACIARSRSASPSTLRKCPRLLGVFLRLQ
ncbi:hypothetical protein D3C72_1676560 [compost metagenome]